jgi:hypothetical protein
MIFQINVINGKKLNSSYSKKNNLRVLWDNTIEYDTSNRYDEDLESIKQCKNSEYKYFIQYVTGHQVTFDKAIETKYAVSLLKLLFNKYLTFKILGAAN